MSHAQLNAKTTLEITYRRNKQVSTETSTHAAMLKTITLK